MSAIVISKQLMTADDLLRLPDDGYRYELVRGELLKMTPASPKHGRIVVKLTLRLGNYVEQHNLGTIYAAESGFKLEQDPDTVRAPDISFVARQRIPPEGEPDGFWAIAPDLVAEVISPSDSAEEMQARVFDFLDAGTRLVWVVHPKTQTVTVYRSRHDIHILSRNDVLDGEDVVSGFTCRIGELFE
jgi:Uma2 family endonuclease